jgi:hypothetical protein
MKPFYTVRLVFIKQLICCLAISAWAFIVPAYAITFNVNDLGDTHAVTPAAGTGLDANGKITLRSALEAATATAGSHTVNVPAGTVTLTLGQITVGNAANGNNITISGPGMNVLTVNQTTENRIFSTGTGAVTFLLQNITLNYTGPSVTAYSGGGGAIIAGGAGAATTLINCRITNFQRQLGNGGAISASSGLANHSLTITNCIFTNNKCGGAGGAVSFNSQGGTATITGCTFENNHTGPVGANTGGDGGAVSVTGGGSGGTYLIEKNTFLNNQVENVTGHAGAVMNTNGTLTLRFNRFVGNTCANVSFPPLANVIAQAGGATTHVTIADNNWWGVNTGPGPNDATALAAGAVITLTKWLQLKTTASPNSICASNPSNLGNTSAITTSFLSNSASEAIAVGNLPVLIGLPVTWSSTLGSLSGQQGTIQAAGTATATFTSNGTGGTATVNARVDNIPAGETAPARVNITVNTLSTAPTGATGTTTICTGDNTILTVAGGSKGTGATTQWFTGSCGGTPAGTGDAITVSPATTTTYYVRYSGTCNTTTCATVTVTVNTLSTAPTGTTGTTTICGGSSTLLTVAGGSKGTGATTQWFTGSCGGPSAGTGDAITVSPATTTTYYVRYNGTCNTTTCATVTVTVNPLPVITAPTVTQPNCATPTGTIVVNATGSGALEYQLNSGAFQSSNTFSGLAPGNYNITVRLQSSPSCLSTYVGNPVVLNAATGCCTTPVSAGTLSGPSAICQGGSINITHTGSTGTNTYVVFQSGLVTNSFGSVDEVEAFLATATPGQYCLYVFAYVEAPSCGNIAGFTLAQIIEQCFAGQCYGVTEPLCITVNAPPTINAPTVTQPTCATPTGTIVVNATGGGTLEYQLNAGVFQSSNSFSGLAPGNYNITVRLQSSPSCLSTYSGNPVVLNAATGCCVAPNITAPTVTQPTCAIPAGTVVVNATGGGTLEYQLNAGAFQSSNTFSGLAPGNYNITVRLQSSPSCLSTYSGNPVVLNTPTGCGGCGPVTAILYVNAAVASSGAGSDWSCAMKELSQAVAYANTHPAIKSIWVAKGTYKPTSTTNRAASMVINRADLQIIGGFAGGETNVLQANVAVNPTIISGEIGAVGMGDNSYHLFKIFNVAANANPLVISGFILGQGNANVAGSGNNYGGAALVYNVNAGATVRFIQCLFGQNNAVQGGAIYFDHASAQFDRCIFGLNTATTFGGAVFGFFSSSKFERVVFSQNVAGSAGGAYYTNYGTEGFNKVAFSSNTASGTGGGGGVYQNAANCNYYNTVFENNSAGLGGGIMAYNGSTSRVVNSTFFSNQATTWGGGALLLGTNNSQADVQNSIFWKNRKAGSDNVATADVSYGTGSNVFRNNILQANTTVPADNGVNITNNKRGVDPLFIGEANPGGGDFLFGTADDGLQLQPGSPAVNAGNNTATNGAGLTQDLRDNPRIVCSIVDMGAYENQDCAASLIAQHPMQAKKAELALTAIVVNPFSNELQIRYMGSEKCSAVVYSSTGKTAWQSLEMPPGLTRVVTSSWGTGMYLVVLKTASGKQLTFKALKL